MHWSNTAPSNIALIKYMGKKDFTLNIPTNPSFSYTLSHLLTRVDLELNTNEQQDHYEPLHSPELIQPKLSEAAQNRFLTHLDYLKKQLDFQGAFTVRSANNFPMSCGLASSASSFAALTKCAVNAICTLKNKPLPDLLKQAQWSQRGSGSSCRSFFEPFALWDEQNIEAISLPYQKLNHAVVIINQEEKSISSSTAHHLVSTSPYFEGRIQRAHERLSSLLLALQEKNWKRAKELCWDEFEDMHQLFSSASPAFEYRNAESHAALELIQSLWREYDDGPIVTLDAGPNIHLLFRADHAALQKIFLEEIQKKHALFLDPELSRSIKGITHEI